MAACRACGRRDVDDVEFCPACGARTAEASESPEHAARRSHRPGPLLGFFAGLLCWFLIELVAPPLLADRRAYAWFFICALVVDGFAIVALLTFRPLRSADVPRAFFLAICFVLLGGLALCNGTSVARMSS